MRKNITACALSTDMLFLQRDGRLIVPNVGVQHILEKRQPDALRQLALQIAGAASPEQVLGHEARVASDVYAMGAILYRMLTGYPLYAGRTPEEIAQQTVGAPIPALSHHRPDLPRELGALLAQALAKSPDQRFTRPGVLANAFHQIVDPYNTARIPFVEGTPQPPSKLYAGTGNTSEVLDHLVPDTAPIASPPPPPPGDLYPAGIPYPAPSRANRLRVILAVVLAVVLVGGTGLALLQQRLAPAGASGQVHFFDAQGAASDGLTIHTTNVAAPPDGMHYQAWLIDPLNEHVLALGTLQAQNQTFTLTYANAGAGVNLLGAGNQVEITQEQSAPPAPVGKVVLLGIFPPQTFIHIRHLVFSFPTTPGKIGLLNGVLSQTHLLSQQAHLLAASDGATARNQCLMRAMLDTLEGAQGANYQPLSAECRALSIASGDGFGLLASNVGGENYATATGYLAEASAHATLAIQQPDVTRPIRGHADRVIIALGNIKGWTTTLDADLLAALAHPADAAQLTTITTLADEAYAGQTNSGSQSTASTDPARAGAIFAYAEGQLMADLPLSAH